MPGRSLRQWMFRNGSSGPRARDLAYGQPHMVRPSSPHRAIWMVAVAVFCTYTRLSVWAKPVARATTSCACVCTVASKRLSAFSSFSTRARTIAVSLDLSPAINWVLGTSKPGMLDSPSSARRDFNGASDTYLRIVSPECRAMIRTLFTSMPPAASTRAPVTRGVCPPNRLVPA